jgi:hypothetical protein
MVHFEVESTILNAAAPPKPSWGEPCNGCGICCAAEPCPLGQIVFLRRSGSCPALAWQGERYVCGLVTNPMHYLSWLPNSWNSLASRCVTRWIAAGCGCDSHAEVAIAQEIQATGVPPYPGK